MKMTRAQWIARFVLPHEPALRSWLAARLPAGMEVDDIVQETYSALAMLECVEHIEAPRAYLFAAARRVALQQLRRARIVRFESIAELERLQVVDEGGDPERQAVAGEELRRLARAIKRLPDKCREAFMLRKVDGLSQREIAEKMQISQSTVEKHIVKALRLLMAMAGREAVQERRRKAQAGVQQGGWHGHGQKD